MKRNAPWWNRWKRWKIRTGRWVASLFRRPRRSSVQRYHRGSRYLGNGMVKIGRKAVWEGYLD